MHILLALILAAAALFAPALPPCATDETPEQGVTACYWDGAHRGNGQGDSFIWTGTDVVLLPR